MKITVDKVTVNTSIAEVDGTFVKITNNKKVSIIQKEDYKPTDNIVEEEFPQEIIDKITELTSGNTMDKLKEIDIKKVLNEKFIDCNNLARALQLAVNNEENAIIYGPGGYGKSDMVKEILKAAKIYDKTFIMSCGDDTDETKLLGGINIPKYQNGILEYNIKDSFMNYEVVVFEELLDAQVNALLTLKDILESKEFRKGNQRFAIKTKLVIALTNKSPQEVSDLGEYARALMSRFRIEEYNDWADHSADRYKRLLEKRFIDDKNENKINIIKNLSNIFEILSSKTKSISPRIAISSCKLCLDENTKNIKEILSVLSYVHEIARAKDILKNIGDDLDTKNEMVEIQEIEDEIEKIANGYSKDSDAIETIKSLNKIRKRLANLQVCDDNYNIRKSVEEKTKILVEKLSKNII